MQKTFILNNISSHCLINFFNKTSKPQPFLLFFWVFFSLHLVFSLFFCWVSLFLLLLQSSGLLSFFFIVSFFLLWLSLVFFFFFFVFFLLPLAYLILSLSFSSFFLLFAFIFLLLVLHFSSSPDVEIRQFHLFFISRFLS